MRRPGLAPAGALVAALRLAGGRLRAAGDVGAGRHRRLLRRRAGAHRGDPERHQRGPFRRSARLAGRETRARPAGRAGAGLHRLRARLARPRQGDRHDGRRRRARALPPAGGRRRAGPRRAGKTGAGAGIAARVTFTGVVQRDDVARHVAAFDIALQPAVVAYASPLKLFEYLALGKAIVAPAQANIAEILTDEDNALLFDPLDPNGLPAALDRLCADAALRQRLAGKARATIVEQGLTWDANAQRAVDLFARLAAHA